MFLLVSSNHDGHRRANVERVEKDINLICHMIELKNAGAFCALWYKTKKEAEEIAQLLNEEWENEE